ncbi:hypothetical protein PPERSA_04417 [Pseudocohnilembus persalinus]|uniref:Uncharacterized protein n=1 Tax=Pseudocohnilembus persalinus TaxID=266149 RepID=A0A0V0QRH6_PSEPJ|nr:hypothetical protein PPERSA_04417 [Pseudocohnilembus persalinus]|eukprot:KRX04602.1 hypothetical protein PPERSA_04417 [Pseudocohnilembus persalinus]
MKENGAQDGREETPTYEVRGRAGNLFQNKTNKQIKEEQKNKQSYAQFLAQQIELKKKQQIDQDIQEKNILSNIAQEHVRKQQYLEQNGPNRDAQGHVNYTRKNPYNPNYEKQDWFSHVGGNQVPVYNNYNQINQKAQLTQSMFLQPNNQPEQFQNQDNNVMMNSFVNQPQQQQQQFQQPVMQQWGGYPDFNNQFYYQQQLFKQFQDLDLLRRQQEQQIQNQNQQLADDRRRKEELNMLEERRRQDLDELRHLRKQIEDTIRNQSLQPIQPKVIYQNNPNEYNGYDKHLFESGQQVLSIDQDSKKPLQWVHKLGNVKKSRKDQYDFDADQNQSNNQNNKNQQQFNNSQNDNNIRRFKANDNESKLKELREIEDQILLEQKIISELPMEVTKQVRNTVNKELLKLRHELNLQNNNIGEQLMNLRGQLMRSQDQKNIQNQELRRLHNEIKQTQIVDEIRQREIYDAFVRNKPQQIIHNKTNLLQDDYDYNSKRVPDSLEYLLTDDNENKKYHARHQTDLGQYKSLAHNMLYNPISGTHIVQPEEYDNNISKLNRLQTELQTFDNVNRSIHGGICEENNIRQILDNNSQRLDKLIELDQNNINTEDKAFADIISVNHDKPDYLPSRSFMTDDKIVQSLDQYVSKRDRQGVIF